ncbi:MAG TPA: glycosyltransferase [Terracidiphilus sp.]|jgi:glycosyltransferase involved in cell wall biosynthesis|nr:glycosyltransferase [Terracidiphilus sp.]
MSKSCTVLLLIPHLGGGGAEQVTAQLASGLDPRKYDLHLGLVTQQEASEFLPPFLSIHSLGARRVRSSAWKLLRLIRQLQPDVILSGMAHLNFLVLLLRPFYPRSTRVIVRQNGPASKNTAAISTSIFYRMLYPRADAIVCQTHAMAAEIGQLTGPTHRFRVLPNPVNVDGLRKLASSSQSLWSGPGPHLLAVGRLAREKGFDLLLGAMASLRRQFPSASLTILGAGPERARLESQSRDLHLEAALHFAGYVPNPAAWFPGATLFVLSSRHEGLPNALLEAAAAGLPIVATCASDGLVNLVNQDPGLWLTSETSIRAIAAALCDALKILRPGQRFAHSWIDGFRMDRAIGAYEALIDATLVEAKQ